MQPIIHRARHETLIDRKFQNDSQDENSGGQLDRAYPPILLGGSSPYVEVPRFTLQDLASTLEFSRRFGEHGHRNPEIKKPGGLGRLLQSRLQQMKTNPLLADWFTAHGYLKKPCPIIP